MIHFCLVFLLLLVVLVLGLPVGFGLGVTSVILSWFGNISLEFIVITVGESLESFTLLAIPLFVIMSQVLLSGKVGDSLFETVNSWIRHLPGGLGVATVCSCAVFASITGSGAATAATIGMVAYPSMIKRGYDKKFTLGLLATGGTLGILLPPSIPMILYSSLTDTSLDKLFIAGIIPGLLLTLILATYTVWRCRNGSYIAMEPATMAERWSLTVRNLPGIFLPILVIGGIYSGKFTPTEAAAIGLMYSLFITLFLYKTIRFSELPKICLKSLSTSSMICMIIVGAHLFSKAMTMLQIPQELTQLVADNNLSPLMFVFAMNLLMLILGAALETISVILLTVPLVFPIMLHLNIDPIWYGVVLTVNMSIALITPPVGMDLYVIKSLNKDIKLGEVIRGVVPFIVLMLGLLLFAILFPPLSTWLPSFMKS